MWSTEPPDWTILWWVPQTVDWPDSKRNPRMPPSDHDSQKVALEIKSFGTLSGTKYSILYKVQVRYCLFRYSKVCNTYSFGLYIEVKDSLYIVYLQLFRGLALWWIYRVLFCSSVLNLAELVALRPDLASLKKIIYFHENQLVYPVREKKDRDIQHGYNQILSW